MRREHARSVVRITLGASSLVACVGNAPSSDQTPVPSASTASRAAAPLSHANAPSSSSSASTSAMEDAGSRFACTYRLPDPTAPLARIPASVLAQALIPSLDPASMKARVVRGDGGVSVVVDCHGSASPATWEEPPGTKRPTPPGTVRVLGTKPLPDQREAVWLATATDLGACAPDGYGFLAIVALEGSELAVLGVSPWHPSCGPTRELRAEKLAGMMVYVEPDKEGARAGFDAWENVWTLKDGDLHLAGRYDTLQVGAAGSGAPVDDAGLYPPSFSATPRFLGREILVSGESTWMKPAPADAKSGDPRAFAKKAPYLRRYELRGDALVETRKEHFGPRKVF